MLLFRLAPSLDGSSSNVQVLIEFYSMTTFAIFICDLIFFLCFASNEKISFADVFSDDAEALTLSSLCNLMALLKFGCL